MILAIDSSSMGASVAIVGKDTIISEYTVNMKKTHSQTLLPMIDEIVKMTGIEKKEIKAIAVTKGPGSFTGLRIGAATAKGLALALDIGVIPVSTIESMAYSYNHCNKLICPIMDARRNQVYTGIYEFDGNGLKVVEPQMAVDLSEIAEKLNALGREVIFLGDGFPVYEKKLEELVKVPYTAAPAHMSRQRAGALAALAMCYAKEGRMETAVEHQPDYLRLSQAERERADKEKAEKGNV